MALRFTRNEEFAENYEKVGEGEGVCHALNVSQKPFNKGTPEKKQRNMLEMMPKLDESLLPRRIVAFGKKKMSTSA